MVYNFVLKNIQEYYERAYKRIQDVISSIGGINQAITIIAIYLNSFYNNCIILSDTELLLHSSIDSEKKIYNKNVLNKNCLNDEHKSPKNKDKINDINKNIEAKIESEHKNSRKNNKDENDISINDNSKSTTNKKIWELTEKSTKNLEIFKIINNNPKEKEEGTEKNQNRVKKTFCNYILYRLTCGKKKDNFNMYKNFRIKIISEEHLVRNHLNIYNLLKVTESKRLDRQNSYQLNDLISLV